ncbi:hypothetical protein MIR68_008485 [Amoeboaphelidium protococcarum]|nr:hypothetical protein MIR68_008485 [Amoeboaphelidium protococcarum]
MFHKDQGPFIVGGILAQSQYDIRGRSDTVFKGLSQNTLLTTECKKASAFVLEKLWHHGSRGIQVFSTVQRTGSPTILYSQRALKAFVENDSRDAVLTWPCSSSLDGSSTVPFSMERVAASYTIRQMTSEIKHHRDLLNDMWR